MPDIESASASVSASLSGPAGTSPKLQRQLKRYWNHAEAVHTALRGALARRTRSALGRAVAKGEPNALNYLVREKVRSHGGNAAFRKAVCSGVGWKALKNRSEMAPFEALLPELLGAFRGEPAGTAIVVYAIQNFIFDGVCARVQTNT